MLRSKNKKSIFWKVFFGIFLIIIISFTVLYIYLNQIAHIPMPKGVNEEIRQSVTILNDSNYTVRKLGPNWLRKNKFGVWEMYLEGEPYKRGKIYGMLAEQLIQKQEDVFVRQIDKMVPSAIQQYFLKYFLAWFNQDLHQHVPDEFLQEIYGISEHFSDEHDHIATKYQRILNYHAAHDIGHMLQGYKMVGCSSFAVQNSHSADSNLLIGRNFDFYMGEDFAKEKLITFMAPSNGIPFVMYGWAGFVGAASGMNAEGLTVTINAGPSQLPTQSKLPISLLVREILQYAATIDQAITIAKKRHTFVSESILVGSAHDKRAIIIEKTPDEVAIFEPSEQQLICSNHFQSKLFATASFNQESMAESDSKYRYELLESLIKNNAPLTVELAVDILRNKNGKNNSNIGYGNPKAINQLIAHHSVVFQPMCHKVWLSTPPYQLGAFLCYDLNNIFGSTPDPLLPLHIDSLKIVKDPFLDEKKYKQYSFFRKWYDKITLNLLTGQDFTLTEDEVSQFIDSNPNSYLVYLSLGRYFQYRKDCEKATSYFEKALTLEVSSQKEIDQLNANIKKCSTN